MNKVSEMLSVDEALTRVMAAFQILPSEQVSLTNGLGRVLAEDVAARVTQPPVAVSSMDGYAVRAIDIDDVPITLTQIGMSQAGQGFDGLLAIGGCDKFIKRPWI